MLLTEDVDVVSYLGATIEDALRDPSHLPGGLAGGLAGGGTRGVRLRLGLVDPDCVLLVDCASAEVRPGRRGEPGVSGVVAMAGDTALALCRGQVDLDAAVASGQIAVDGAGGMLLDLLSGHRLAAVG